ncbi:MAG: antitermination protein NusG [Pirellulales bacterium]|nr:antitermination protein NusG [Pirellulales bacterium]
MPILAREPNVFPPDLLDFEHSNCTLESTKVESGASNWWVLYTRSRQEKSLARDLLQREIPFYLPLVRRRLLIRGRPVHSQVPLFTGYVFIYGSPSDRTRALMTNRISQTLLVDDGRRLQRDLRNVQHLIDRGTPLTVESRLEPNQRVRVRAGALMGLEGIVQRRKNATRIAVWINMLQQGVSVEIEDYLLEPLD